MKSRRFELVDGKSSKFWTIEVGGKTMRVVYGRIGTEGRSLDKVLEDPERYAAALVKEKTEKGYVEVKTSKAAANTSTKERNKKPGNKKPGNKKPGNKLLELLSQLHANPAFQSGTGKRSAKALRAASVAPELEVWFNTLRAGELGLVQLYTADRAMQTKKSWDDMAMAFETGKDDAPHFALWHRDWIPIADDMSATQWAFATNSCFGGPAGQVIEFDFKGGNWWRVAPSLACWLEAVLETYDADAEEGPEPSDWLRQKKCGGFVEMPKEYKADRKKKERFAIKQRKV